MPNTISSQSIRFRPHVINCLVGAGILCDDITSQAETILKLGLDDLILLNGNLLCFPGNGRDAACFKDSEVTGLLRRCHCRMDWAWCAFFLCGLVILLAGGLADSASKMLEGVEVRAELSILVCRVENIWKTGRPVIKRYQKEGWDHWIQVKSKSCFLNHVNIIASFFLTFKSHLSMYTEGCL